MFRVMKVMRDSMGGRLLAFCVAGALFGSAVEYLHMKAGVWALPAGRGFPGWIAVVYFLALLALGLLFKRYRRAWCVPTTMPYRVLLMEVAGLVVLMVLPPLMHGMELVLMTLVGAGLVSRLVRFPQSGDLRFALGVATADLVLELIMTRAGLYSYTVASLGPLPLWLPLLWAGMGLGLRRVYTWVLT